MYKSVFVPYIGALGGVERLLLSLSSYLHVHAVEHEIICFRDTLGIAAHANWPLTVTELKPARRVLSEALALRACYRQDPRRSAASTLVFDLKGAYYFALAGLCGYTLHLTDPPSLLLSESSRHSATYRRWANTDTSVPLTKRTRGEAVHLVNRRGVRRAGNVIAMTNRIADEIESLYGVRARIVRPGVDAGCPMESMTPRSSDGRFHVLSVSRLEQSKRLDLAIRAIHELELGTNASRKNEWVLDIVGAGPARAELEQYAAFFGVSEHVRFHGRVSDDELERLYQTTDVFVMPAVQGYGLPALESLQRCVPIVMHRDSGVSEILAGSPWVEIIDDACELAPALQRLRGRINLGPLCERTKPTFPSDTQWAEQICRECAWTR